MKKERKMFDKPENVKRLLGFFYASLVVLVLVDLLIHKHAAFPWQEAPAFFAAYGLVSCAGLVFMARLLRLLVKRNEEYYD